MPVEIQELHIKTTVSPREALARIIAVASGGQAGINTAARGVMKLSGISEGKTLLKRITEKFTLFNESGTPVRAVSKRVNAYPIKWKGPLQQGSSNSAQFNPNEFALSKTHSWTEAKSRQFVLACLGTK